jgi:hypothetical protein
MKQRAEMWHALPRDVAQWWRDRDASAVVLRDGKPTVMGPVKDRAAVVEITLDGGMPRYGEVR